MKCSLCSQGFVRDESAGASRCCRCPAGRARARRFAKAMQADLEQEKKAKAARRRTGKLVKLEEELR